MEFQVRLSADPARTLLGPREPCYVRELWKTQEFD